MASDHLDLAVNAESAVFAVRLGIWVELCLARLTDYQVGRAVALGRQAHIHAVIEDECLDVGQRRIFFVSFDAYVVPDGEKDSEVGRHVAVIEEFSHDIVHFRVQVELGIGELDSEAAPHGHLAIVFEFARLVDTGDLDVATFDLLGEIGLDLLEFVTETPRVDRLGLDDAREAVGSSDVAALLARGAVLARTIFPLIHIKNDCLI